MSVILSPFSSLLLLFYDWTGSYGVSLILFCLVVRTILFPVFLKGRKSMMAMNGLAEQQKLIQQKYARDREKYSIELQKLYEREGVKPSGGCLWSVVPLLVLIPLYGIVSRPLTNLMGMNEDQVATIADMLYGAEAASMNITRMELGMAQDVYLNYDKIISALPELSGMPQIDFTFLGMNLAQTPSLFFWQAENVAVAFGLWMIPVISAVLSAVSMVVTNKINAYITGIPRNVDPTTRSMMIMMPLMSLWFCFTLPAALGLYWIANSVVAMLSEAVNIPFLKKYLKKLAEDKEKRVEEEKERAKRERLAQAEAKKKAQEEMRRIQMERKLNKNIATASREGLRTYARGRLYDPDRYPTFPYKDPNKILKEQQAQAELAKAEQENGKGEKGKKKSKKDKEPVVLEKETPVIPTPVPAPAEEEEEVFIEESFLEEPTEDNEEV